MTDHVDGRVLSVAVGVPHTCWDHDGIARARVLPPAAREEPRPALEHLEALLEARVDVRRDAASRVDPDLHLLLAVRAREAEAVPQDRILDPAVPSCLPSNLVIVRMVPRER